MPLAKLQIREVTLFGILGAMTFAAKYVMSGLPNIEPVSLMVMVFGAVFGKKAVYPVYLYVLMEFLFYGLGIWNVMYLYIWPGLAFVAYLLRRMESPMHWALLSGAFGLLFGAACMPVDIVIGGFSYAAAKWISGIPFDITHCIGNFAIALILFRPLHSLTQRLYAQMMP
ncbi:MAG: hypothetical protein IJE81_00195 [Oscillospiraceae bacterium]|nr:hypothetical protein [Oscillospiraceae bacterium]